MFLFVWPWLEVAFFAPPFGTIESWGVVLVALFLIPAALGIAAIWMLVARLREQIQS